MASELKKNSFTLDLSGFNLTLDEKYDRMVAHEYELRRKYGYCLSTTINDDDNVATYLKNIFVEKIDYDTIINIMHFLSLKQSKSKGEWYSIK